MKLTFSPLAKKQITHLSPLIKKGVRELVDVLALGNDPGKSLIDELSGLKSLPYKRYRIIYRYISQKNIEIICVSHRATVYKEVLRLKKT